MLRIENSYRYSYDAYAFSTVLYDMISINVNFNAFLVGLLSNTLFTMKDSRNAM